eukprot:scaffold7909_cov42-Attheya_sp.AAC.3
MEDLRVLEQQQLESQRNLTTIKLIKSQKHEQRTSLETKLSSLKFTNGEQRAQLQRYREVLSNSTRELGAVKLRAERSGDDLKRFDEKLKKALLTARILKVNRRKVDAAVIQLRHTESVLSGRKVELLDCRDEAKTKFINVKHKEEHLLQSIQNYKAEAKKIAEQTSRMRNETSNLEEDLATAQQMEASTKFRAESIATEIANEVKRHVVAKSSEESKLFAITQKKADLEVKVKTMAVDILIKRNLLNEAWKRCVKIQTEEGHEPSPQPADGQPSPSINIDQISSKLEKLEICVSEEKEKAQSMVRRIDTLKADYSDTEKQTIASTQEGEVLRQRVSRDRNIETSKEESHAKTLANVHNEREAVATLKRSVTDLEESQELEKTNDSTTITNQNGLISELEKTLEVSKNHLTTENQLLKDMKIAAENAKTCSIEAIQTAHANAEEVKNKFEQAQQKVKELADSSGSEENQELSDISRAQKILIQDKEAEIEKHTKSHPCLQQIKCAYDATETTEKQASDALSGLRRACEDRIASARKERNDRAEAKTREVIALRKKEERDVKRAEREAAQEAQRLKNEKMKLIAKQEAIRRAEIEAEEARRLEMERELELEEQRNAEAELAEKNRLEEEERRARKRKHRAKEEAERLRIEHDLLAAEAFETEKRLEAKTAAKRERARVDKARKKSELGIAKQEAIRRAEIEAEEARRLEMERELELEEQRNAEAELTEKNRVKEEERRARKRKHRAKEEAERLRIEHDLLAEEAFETEKRLEAKAAAKHERARVDKARKKSELAKLQKTKDRSLSPRKEPSNVNDAGSKGLSRKMAKDDSGVEKKRPIVVERRDSESRLSNVNKKEKRNRNKEYSFLSDGAHQSRESPGKEKESSSMKKSRTKVTFSAPEENGGAFDIFSSNHHGQVMTKTTSDARGVVGSDQKKREKKSRSTMEKANRKERIQKPSQSQTSGISSMEVGKSASQKSRRRKKKDGGKGQTQRSMDIDDGDYSFRF